MMNSSYLNQHFSKGGKEEASAGAELAGADVTQEVGPWGPVIYATVGVLGRENLGNFTFFCFVAAFQLEASFCSIFGCHFACH